MKNLISNDLMHESGYAKIEIAKQNGSWTELYDVENGIVPNDLKVEFDKNPEAYTNYQNFSPSYRKSYLYWLNQAKREDTRKKRITEIIHYTLIILKAETIDKIYTLSNLYKCLIP